MQPVASWFTTLKSYLWTSKMSSAEIAHHQAVAERGSMSAEYQTAAAATLAAELAVLADVLEKSAPRRR